MTTKKKVGLLALGFVTLMALGIAGMSYAGASPTATAETVDIEDWPTIEFVYERDAPVNGGVTTRRYRMTYDSLDSWTEEVIVDEPVDTQWGSFSEVGSYRRLQDGVFTDYSVITGQAYTEQMEDGTNALAMPGLRPFPIDLLEQHLGKGEEVSTDYKVCFRSECDETATGWQYTDGDQQYIFADDVRGIPLKFGVFEAIEVSVQDAKRPIVADDDGK
jgi:hypothetical protein